MFPTTTTEMVQIPPKKKPPWAPGSELHMPRRRVLRLHLEFLTLLLGQGFRLTKSTAEKPPSRPSTSQDSVRNGGVLPQNYGVNSLHKTLTISRFRETWGVLPQNYGANCFSWVNISTFQDTWGYCPEITGWIVFHG